jgi:HEAT repeat protein
MPLVPKQERPNTDGVDRKDKKISRITRLLNKFKKDEPEGIPEEMKSYLAGLKSERWYDRLDAIKGLRRYMREPEKAMISALRNAVHDKDHRVAGEASDLLKSVLEKIEGARVDNVLIKIREIAKSLDSDPNNSKLLRELRRFQRDRNSKARALAKAFYENRGEVKVSCEDTPEDIRLSSKVLYSNSWIERLDAIKGLRRYMWEPNERIVRLLKIAANDENNMIAEEAKFLLERVQGSIQKKRVEKVLIEVKNIGEELKANQSNIVKLKELIGFLEDECPQVRAVAARISGDIKSIKIFSRLKKMYKKDNSIEVRAVAFAALSKIRGIVDVSIITNALTSDDSDEMRMGIMLIDRIIDAGLADKVSDMIKMLCQIVKNPNTYIQWEETKLLGRINSPGGLSIYHNVLTHRAMIIQKEAADVLRKMQHALPIKGTEIETTLAQFSRSN